jgi:hypothetical protein
MLADQLRRVSTEPGRRIPANEPQFETTAYCGSEAGKSCNLSELRAAWLDGAGLIKGFLRDFACAACIDEGCAPLTFGVETPPMAAGNNAERDVDLEIVFRA